MLDNRQDDQLLCAGSWLCSISLAVVKSFGDSWVFTSVYYLHTFPPFNNPRMKVHSNAAICSLTVSQNVLENDIVLQLVTKLASPLQLSVKVEKKSKNQVLELKTSEESVTLTQRCAILRALCGLAMYYSLDQAPYYLMGGYAQMNTSHVGAVNYSAIMALQSLADSLNLSSEKDVASTIEGLEQTLESSMFLLPATSQPTIADMDIACKIREEDLSSFPNVERWRATVLNTMVLYGEKVGFQVPLKIPASSDPPLAFFYGTEDLDSVLKVPEQSKSSQQGVSKKKPKEEKKKDTKKKEAKSGGAQEPKKEQQQTEDVNISALDIRVGKIVKAWHHEEADKLFCEEIDLGTETRQIASGLRPFYKTEDLEGRMVLVLCNLKKRNLVGFPSHGMVLCASNDDHTAVEFVVPPSDAKLGERVTFEGFEGEPEPEAKVGKKKIFEKLAPDLKTDPNGNVVWKGTAAKTSAGAVVALNKMPNAHVS